MNRELLEGMLATQGHRVLLASSGEQALELARKHRPNLILIDIRMPGMSGYRLSEMLRADPLTDHLVIVLITGMKITPAIQQEAQRFGAHDVISRIMSVDSLNNYVRDILAEYSQSDD
jgi:CheY-like chemotaxis protein